jgi:hypothetical protein
LPDWLSVRKHPLEGLSPADRRVSFAKSPTLGRSISSAGLQVSVDEQLLGAEGHLVPEIMGGSASLLAQLHWSASWIV